VGVRERTSGIDTLVFRKDPKNGGGAFVTSDPRLAAELKELPKGLIITEPFTPASAMEDVPRRPGKTPESADGTHQNGINEASSSSLDSMNTQDQAGPRGGSVPHSASSYMQNQNTNSASPSDAVLESIPGNLFDWGTFYFIDDKYYSNTFDRRLGPLASDPRIRCIFRTSCRYCPTISAMKWASIREYGLAFVVFTICLLAL
jgi:hypothetical protein